jgi:NADH-quinone oxidoreductase subunit M
VLQGAAMVNFNWAIFAALGVILSACYMLWLYQRTFLGETGAEVRHHVHDLSFREMAAIAPLLLLMLWMGTLTEPFLKPISTANSQVIQLSNVNVEYQVQRAPAAAVGGGESRSAR